MEKSNLPVPVEKNLPAKVKKGFVKAGKVVGYSAAMLGMLGVGVAFPILLAPATIGALYPAQKLLNETLYKSYPDLAFVLKKHGNNMKIYQDIVRPDILSEMKGLSEVEKAGFLQLQAIVGLSKESGFDKQGNPITYETDTHGVVQKTFRKLSDLGYIENYQETFLKNSHLILPKLAFGNTGAFKKKSEIYNIKFQRTEKPIDFSDPDLKRFFPAIFSKRKGLFAKRNYQVLTNPDGTLSIDYKAKEDPCVNREDKREAFVDSLQEGSPSLEEQRDYSMQVQEEQKLDNEQSELKIGKDR